MGREGEGGGGRGECNRSHTHKFKEQLISVNNVTTEMVAARMIRSKK